LDDKYDIEWKSTKSMHEHSKQQQQQQQQQKNQGNLQAQITVNIFILNFPSHHYHTPAYRFHIH